PTLIFDFADPLIAGSGVHRLAFTQPERVIVARTIAEVRPALREVEQATRDGFYAAGMICYEAAPAFDAAMHAHSGGALPLPLPLLWFGVFRAPTSLPRVTKQHAAVSGWEPDAERQKYDANILKIREAIARGDTYQVNYTLRLNTSVSGDPRAWYEALAAQSHGRFNAFLDLGEKQILSLSPELFFAWDGKHILTRPMKGTLSRAALPSSEYDSSAWQASDEAEAHALVNSEKNRAENLMIVDLLRNDLSRIAVTGSVAVPKLFSLETYPTVHHMTSTVTATTREGVTLEDVFCALFPCGSITGAPKIKTTEIIASLEDSPRGIYCGALGYITPDQRAVFNVPIRTITMDSSSGMAQCGVGGGITWDSTAGEEYAEALTKARFLGAGAGHFELLETLMLQDTQYAFLDRHMSRLQRAAKRFGHHADVPAIRAALTAHAATYAHQLRRVRLLVSLHGEITVTSTALQAAPGNWLVASSNAERVKVAVATRPVDSRHEFLRYKTTARSAYDVHIAVSPDAFDILLWNERDELTEFTRGNVVVSLDGKFLTPKAPCGLLPGVLRAELLERNIIEEAVVHRNDLARADAIWFINSVRGWLPVAFAAA
ncbi:MAG: aminodeoxychorismate synthase component I, partial [Aeromicrobium sp.]|nr:aminodeoxychorismate synthase component I [Burkholderiales bacterium]